MTEVREGGRWDEDFTVRSAAAPRVYCTSCQAGCRCPRSLHNVRRVAFVHIHHPLDFQILPYKFDKMEVEKANHSRTRDEEFDFEDGSLILAVQGVEFRVHTGVLSRHSPVFKDMAALGSEKASSDEMSPPCPVVELQDSARDWRHVLRAIYQNDPLSRHCAIGIVNIARLVGDTSILPLAFLSCNQLGRKLLQGATPSLVQHGAKNTFVLLLSREGTTSTTTHLLGSPHRLAVRSDRPKPVMHPLSGRDRAKVRHLQSEDTSGIGVVLRRRGKEIGHRHQEGEHTLAMKNARRHREVCAARMDSCFRKPHIKGSRGRVGDVNAGRRVRTRPSMKYGMDGGDGGEYELMGALHTPLFVGLVQRLASPVAVAGDTGELRGNGPRTEEHRVRKERILLHYAREVDDARCLLRIQRRGVVDQ
ncbi:uncharacterized protein BXZ73DRAFT_78993 [Epithele typhae]|uniref:uncharacterized protein n=1 Tax=Epithele typhae TaxID=378194 RepID=UPI002008E1F2|nr:uncharacterized protein BXZ73DRAFT_78993 [Epithele typhae]KAH9925675.1 hypothetical protein BXZ73DRAFT_78993 [Epithele typhae]